MGGNGKHRWSFSFNRYSSSSPTTRLKDPPKEFICPISASLMFDPIVISSGQTYDRTSAQVCRDLGFTPPLPDGSIPDFSALIPNLALKSTILNWCNTVGIQHPSAPDYYSLQNTVRSKMDTLNPSFSESEKHMLNNLPENPPAMHKHSAPELNLGNSFCSSSSEESVIANVGESTSLRFTTRPSCFSGSDSTSTSFEILTDENTLIPNSSSTSSTLDEEEHILIKLRSFDVFDNKQGLINLRKITRTNGETRVSLCTPRILTALRSALISKYVAVQTNAAAAVINLSLEKVNKVKIVRSGIVPPLIDVLKGGFSESQEHAAGALFSLALEDDNRTAIGVLGGLQPLLHALRLESGRTRHDSALALYHLSFIQSNRVKLIKLGAVSTLLSLLQKDDMAGRVLLVLCNLANSVEGKSTMLHSNAVESLVGLLRKVNSESTREKCIVVLYSLSRGTMKFKTLAEKADATEVLREVLNCKLSQLGKEKAKAMLSILRERERDAGEDVDWEQVMKNGPSRNGYRVGSSPTQPSFDLINSA